MGKYSKLATQIVDFGTAKSNPREYPVTKITIHHMAGNIEADDCARMHRDSSVQCSANYYISSTGDICGGVSEDRRAWTSCSWDNDQRAITIEVANNSGEPNWTVSNKAYEATIALCADICQRYGIEPHYNGTPSGTLTIHQMFVATNCCGPYLIGKHKDGSIERDIKAKMGGGPTPQPTETLYRVQCGAFRKRENALNLQKELQSKGYQTYIAVTQDDLLRVQVGAFRKKENADKMLSQLKADGYSDAFITTNPNSSAIDPDIKPNKSNYEIALEVIRGEWGNDPERSERLSDAGYNPAEIQAIVNDIYSRR
jgi:N-acetyl-anhydromuramyl-L-alanine amidase AmpD